MTTTSYSTLDIRRTPPRVTLVVSLLVAAAGILTEFATGVGGFPKLPPGPIILLVIAVAIAVIRWRWIPAAGLLVAIFLTAGLFLAGTGGRLTNPGSFGPFLGTWLQLIAQIVAIVAGGVAIVAAARFRRT
ncbi:MAG TPA: hypothetical protein VG756_30530 [Pseudonocardiaceae bacterium]|jgi:hypothetical protein|nr:hypothetical protein [Pseudonocardiaceae bacterium]